MKTVMIGVLALLVIAGAVMLSVAPAMGYDVTCTRQPTRECVLEQARLSSTRHSTVALDSVGAASVRIVTNRRGHARVLLYLNTPARAYFAAEFEGTDADTEAAAAAAQLNTFLRSPEMATVHVVARAPRLTIYLGWAGIGLASLLLLATWRNTRRPATA